MSQLCRIDAFFAIHALAVGSDYSVDVCDRPATYAVVMQSDPGEGVALRLDVAVCDGHECELSGLDSYVRSIKCRDRPAERLIPDGFTEDVLGLRS